MPVTSSDRPPADDVESKELGDRIEPGVTLGDTKLIREIGRGAQGVVYEGQQRSVHRRVAVKILPRDIVFDETQVSRFRLEAEAAARLNHPNIVAVYGFGEVGGHRMLTVEYVAGGTLDEELERRAQGGRTDVAHCQWAAGICAQLAHALQHAHDAGVIHRDVKPSNVMLTPGGVPKLTDFGLARVADKGGLSRTGAVMGTPHYMSPEQVKARVDEIDGRTDVYSLGAVLYRMLTSRPPFVGETAEHTFIEILTREPTPPSRLQPGVASDLEAVCLKALEKERASRYATARAFAEDLERYLAGEPTLARPLGPIGRSVRILRRQATSTLAVFAVLVPTAWVAADILLQARAREDVAVHDLRVGALAAGALVLAWPLVLLAERLAKGRRLGMLAAALALVAVTLLGAGTIREQAANQRHDAAYARLETTIEHEIVGDRRDASELEDYAARWAERLRPKDASLLAWGYLKRERPVVAARWLRSAADLGASGPTFHALSFATFSALGEEQHARAASEALTMSATQASSWEEWRRVGDVLFDMGRFLEARSAYERAGRMDGAGRDLLNLSLARTVGKLCLWSEVPAYLDDYLRWNSEDPDAHLIAFEIAIAAEDHDRAAQHLETYRSQPSTTPLDVVELSYQLLASTGEAEAASALLAQTAEGDGLEDPATLAWCAAQLLEAGRMPEAYAEAYRKAGIPEEAERHAAEALAAYERARTAYWRLSEATGWDIATEIGLAAVAIEMSDVQPDAADAFLNEAVSHARRAVALDEGYWHAHYDLGLARWRLALLREGAASAAELSLAGVESYLSDYRRAIDLNGVQANVLNDAADALARVFVLTRDRAALAEAFGYVNRAIGILADPAPGACPPSDTSRRWLSALYVTLAELHELDGALDEALAAARLSIGQISGNDPQDLRARRFDNVSRLQTLVDEGR